MKDPLQSEGPEQELFNAITQLCSDRPSEHVCSVVCNVLVHAIRQKTPYRKDAEAAIDDWFGRAKTLLLDQHYDAVTGQRRSVFPFTQVIQAPFHVEDDVMFRR